MKIKNYFKKVRKRGDVFILSLFFILIGVVFLGFAYDVARVMYYKTYVKNLSSVMALSVVNECGFVYQDNINGARVVIVYGSANKPSGYKGKYFANKDYIQFLYNNNKSGMDSTCHIDPSNIKLNPVYTKSGNVMPGSINKKRFETGSDGVNGEVEVRITANVDLLFLKFGSKDYMTITESAIAQPTASTTANYEQIRNEQQISYSKSNLW